MNKDIIVKQLERTEKSANPFVYLWLVILIVWVLFGIILLTIWLFVKWPVSKLTAESRHEKRQKKIEFIDSKKTLKDKKRGLNEKTN